MPSARMIDEAQRLDHSLQRFGRQQAQGGSVLDDPYHYSDVTATNADEIAVSLHGFEQEYQQISPGGFAGRMTTIRFDGFQIAREFTNGSTYEQGAPVGDRCNFVFPLSMAGRVRCLGREVTLHDAFVIAPSYEYDLQLNRELVLGVLSIERESLRDFAQQVDDEVDVDAVGAGTHILHGDPRLVDDLRRLFESTFAHFGSNQTDLRKPQIRHELRTSILTALLALFGCESDEPSVHPSARHPLVERATNYVLTRQHEVIGIEDVCREVHVSRRKLQYCFQQELGISPAQYLRALRLRSARRMLQATKPNEKSIADVASDFGFWHFSRFAQHYRKMFGELPSQTSRAERTT